MRGAGIPDTIAIGTASSSGHGVATTRTDRARVASPTAHATPATAVIGTKIGGVPVGESDERRLLALGLLHEAHDPGVRAPSAVVVARRSNAPPAFTAPDRMGPRRRVRPGATPP